VICKTFANANNIFINENYHLIVYHYFDQFISYHFSSYFVVSIVNLIIAI